MIDALAVDWADVRYPYLTLATPTLPYPTLPYPTLPYPSLS
jgi:hypothetical protein